MGIPELKEWLEDNGWFVMGWDVDIDGDLVSMEAIKNGRFIHISAVLDETSPDWVKDFETHGGQFIVARTVEDLEAQLVPPRNRAVAEGRKDVG